MMDNNSFLSRRVIEGRKAISCPFAYLLKTEN
jgi:hypothetical protein